MADGAHHQSAPAPAAPQIVLAAYRERIMYWFAIIVIASITPFGINNLIHHQYELTVAIAALVVALAVDAIAVHLKKSPPIPYPLLLIPVAGSIALSLSHQGLYGVLWCYPSILFCYFVLNWRMAVACSVGMLAVFTGMVYHFVSPDVAIRFFVSLGMTILAINIIAHIINDLQRQLLDQVVTDPLTGAYNRRHMNLVLAEAIERRRRSGAAASLLVIDIDHFKQINDTYGHAVGDRVLKELVALISEKSRRLDRLFRMGGEEFLLFLPDTRIADAVVRAENLRQLIANAPLLAKRPVTASIGVSELADDLAPDTWIKRADDALYAAKQNGRNRVICAPPQTPVAAAASSASVSLPS